MTFRGIILLSSIIFGWPTSAMADPVANPLESMVGTRSQNGVLQFGENKAQVSSEVTCTQTASAFVVVCHGKNGPDFSWLDTLSWNPKTRILTKTSLGTIPGQGVAILEGEWDSEKRIWSIKGTRKDNNGTHAVIRSTRQFFEDGSQHFQYFEEQGGREVLMLEIKESPLKKSK